MNPTWLVQGLLLWKAPLRLLFIEEQENQNTVKKTKRDVSLLTEFLQTKRETRSEIAEIPPAELNELLSEFILSVHTKEGQDYEPSSL